MVKVSLKQQGASAASKTPVFTVGQVVQGLKQVIEAQFAGAVWIEGELSNCTYPSSGHIYFTLVDEHLTDRFGQRMVLPAAFFRGANQTLKFKLVDGLKVMALGQVTTYESRGQYQLRVLRVEPKGAGALQLAFEQLKKKLAGAGFFDEDRKKALPRFPQIIGVVTSGTGSAIHDIVDKLRGRFHVRIFPVKVQGEGAAEDIAGAIALANRFRAADVLIVGRGGGSVEDLWAFNEEAVANAIAQSELPIISAVGHEDDWSIADYVADVRASTPTEAAERLAFEQQLTLDLQQDLTRRLADVMRGCVEDEALRLESLKARLRLLHPLRRLENYSQRTIDCYNRLVKQIGAAVERESEAVARHRQQMRQSARWALERSGQQLGALAVRLQDLSPLAVLSRGYSITFVEPEGRVAASVRELKPGDAIKTRMADGTVQSLVQSVDLSETNPGKAA